MTDIGYCNIYKNVLIATPNQFEFLGEPFKFNDSMLKNMAASAVGKPIFQNFERDKKVGEITGVDLTNGFLTVDFEIEIKWKNFFACPAVEAFDYDPKLTCLGISSTKADPSLGRICVGFDPAVKPFFAPLYKKHYLDIKNGIQTCEVRPNNHRGWNTKNIYAGRYITLSNGYGNHGRLTKPIIKATVTKNLQEAGVAKWHIEAVESIYGKRESWLVAYFAERFDSIDENNYG